MTVWGSLGDESETIRRNMLERDQQRRFMESLAAHPQDTLNLVNIISRWGDHAPTLPAGAILGLAHGGIGPEGPVGQSIIRNGVPALTQPAGAMERATAALGPMGPQGFDQGAPSDIAPVGAGNYNDQAPASADLPDVLGAAGQAYNDLSAGLRGNRATATQGIEAGAGVVNRNVVAPINRLAAQGQSAASGGSQSPQEVQAMGVGNTDSAKSIVRELGAIGNTGLQATTVPLKLAAAATNEYVRHNPAGSTYEVPFTGAKLTVGSMSDAVSPEQFTLYQQIHGHQDLGTGWLPAGPATEAATAAQQQAGTINGHALTYGRVLASTVTEPGTRPYSIFSGTIDAGVALGLDPMSLALKAGSGSLAAAREFAPLTDEAASAVAHHLVDNANTAEQIHALEDLGGTDNLIDGLARRAQEDPSRVVSVAQSVGLNKGLRRAAAGPQAGVFVGLRPFVHRKTAIEWMSGKAGNAVINRLAADPSFSSIRSVLGDTVPVDVIARLSRADSPDAVRSVLTTELGTSVAGPVSYKAFRPPEDLRLFTQMPHGSIDLTNSQQMVDEATKTLILAKVPKDRWDDVLRPMAEAGTLGDAKNAYVNGLGGVLETKLVEDGVPNALAKKLTRFFPHQWEQQREFNIDATGDVARMAGATVDGEPQLIVGPHLDNELARMVPPLDYRSLRQVTQKHRQLLHFWNDGYVTDTDGFAGGVNRLAHSAARAESYLASQLTGIFKTNVLVAPRVPVRFLADEQAAMASAGIDSMFHNPVSYMAIATGKKAAHDITGTAFNDVLGDATSEFTAALGSAASHNPSPWSADQQLLKAYVHYGKDDPDYVRGWVDELSQLHLDGPSREVARALLNPEHIPAGMEDSALRGVDAVNEWFAEGAGNKYLESLRSADLKWGSAYLNNRAASDAYVQSLVDRIMVKTGGDQNLLDAVAEGRPFNFRKANQGISKSVSHEFRTYLGKMKDDIGPDVVKARARAGRLQGQGVFAYVGDKMLGALMDVPARTLTRSPAFRQWYYHDVQRMLGSLTEDAQAAAIRNAAEDGITLKAINAHGVMELDDIDKVAKARSLAKMHDYLYYPGEKNTAEDILRNVMPFAPAWHSVIKRWTSLVVEHPQIARHAQQGIQSLRSSGFFYRDEHGDERFTMAGGGLIKELTGAVGFPLEGKVAGLNIVGGGPPESHGLPGIGVGVQMLAAAALPKTPITQSIRSFIAPYGDPDVSGGLFESLFPAALQKLRTGGWLKIGNFGWDPTFKQQVAVTDLAKRTFNNAVNSGRYDLSDPQVRQKLYDQSLAQAQRLYLIRGLAQFVVPSAPDYAPEMKIKDGRVLALWKMSKDYAAMLKADNGDGDKATLQLVDKYGPNAVFAVSPMNLKTVYGAPTGIDGLQWKADHSEFAKLHPQTYGYFVPHDDKRGPYQNYLDLFHNGEQQLLTVKQWSELTDQKLGNAIYSQLRSRLGPSPNKAQRAWLQQQKVGIQKQYPGFNIELGLPARATAEERIEDLFGPPGKPGALEDPAVRDSPLAKTAMTYLRLRDQALTAAGKRTYGNRNNPFTAKSMAPYRDWLFQNGTELAKRDPSFIPMWNYLLQQEVSDGN